MTTTTSSQQPPKRQDVAQAYAAETGERKEYAGTLPLCNKCKFHHNGPCTAKCVNCKKVGHLTRDCWNPTTTNNQRTITCYECGNQGHYKSDCPKRKNQNHENQTGGTRARGVFEHEHVVMNPTSAGMSNTTSPALKLTEIKQLAIKRIQRISLTGFPAQSVGSSNTYVLDLPCLLVLITGTSQSRQHVDTSLIHIESRKSPTSVLFDDDTGRISIRHCEY
ncbi:putative reverse transcriptase domain-containing protein [Tanacetum coccineum]